MTHSLADFLSRALVWPDPDSPRGWVNLHWRHPERKGITGGQAFKTLGDTEGFIRWSQSDKGKLYCSDMYFCTSLQAERGDPKRSGKYSAIRSIDNAVSSKLLFADVDKYESKAAAILAIKEFCERSSSPFPTALVDSGGGIHSYWILPEALPKAQWLELAAKFEALMTQHGLLHDNISTDMARILRPPETLNYKRGEPQPVVLKLLNGDVDLGNWKSLKAAVPTVPALAHPTERRSARDDLDLYATPEAAAKKPARAFQGHGFTTRVADGVVVADPVISRCPLFVETLKTGGKDVSQPLWHQQALACTFLVGGRQIFHDLGCKHPDYSRETSDEMFDRKVRDQTLKGLGFPTCASFEACGATECMTCPLRGKVKSPLNITAPVETKEHAINGNRFEIHASVSVEGINGLEFDDEDQLIYVVEKTKTGVSRKPLFDSVLIKAQQWKPPKGNGVGIILTCSSDGGRLVDIPLLASDLANSEKCYNTLSEGGCLVRGNQGKATDTMTTFRGRLARLEKADRLVPYGWIYEDAEDGKDQSTPIGFAYDKKVYKADGTVRSTHGGDWEINEIYSAKGTIEPWLEAYKLVHGMRSPAHAAIVLSAFAAPLMIFTGYPSTIVMMRGDSGGSKSTVSAISAAVWAEPRRALLKPNSSKLGLMKRMGRLRHLPTIWDDIRDDMFDTVKQTLMEITQGGDGIKLDQNRDEREQGIWDNMLITSSNSSLAEYLEEVSPGNGASLYRCYEFEVPEIHKGDQAYVDPHKLAQLVSSLDRNRGHIGREYAAYIGRRPAELGPLFEKTAQEVADLVGNYEPAERYWCAACATLLMALRIVNKLPSMQRVPLFNEAELIKFMVETYHHLRRRMRGATVSASQAGFVKYYLNKFINTYAADRHQIVWTKDVPLHRGKPVSVAPIWPQGDGLKLVKSVAVRYIVNERKVRISKTWMDKFLVLEKVSRDKFRTGILKYYNATLNVKGRMASGIINVSAQGQEPVYEIDVKPGTDLDRQLQQHAIEEGRPEIALGRHEQNHDRSEPHPQPEHAGPEDETDAS